MSCVIEGQQNKYMTVAFSWHNTTTGDKTKIVNVKDTNFKKVLLEKYDIDKDGKFTEYDANNIGSLVYQLWSFKFIWNRKFEKFKRITSI